MTSIPQEAIDRFWSKVRKTDSCWIWIAGSRSLQAGYGEFKYKGRNRVATRFLWELLHGPIPDGMFVLHHCDNPRCVRPDHLFLGTPKDNMVDKSQKKRGNAPKGEDHGCVKLTATAVREIRQKYADGSSLPFLAKEYGVAKSHIHGIVNRRFWRHID